MDMDDAHIDIESTLPVAGRDFNLAVNMRDVATAAVRTLDALEKAGANFPGATPDEKDTARDVFTSIHAPQAAAAPASSPPASEITAGVAVHLRDLLSAYDTAIITSAVQIRTFIVNKLLEETAHPDAKIRLRALELLGKAADINLFTERTPGADPSSSTSEELETRIREKLARIQGRATDVKYTEVDVVRELGL